MSESSETVWEEAKQALAIVATARDADVLATVALAISVISFAGQIGVSLSQSRAASAQLTQAERTHNETRALLSEISTRAAALSAIQSHQFDRVLEAALDPSTIRRAILDATPGGAQEDSGQPGSAPSAGPDLAALSSSLEAAIRDRIRTASAVDVQTPDEMRKYFRPVQYWIGMDPRTYPTEEEGRAAFETLGGLTSTEAALLTRRALEDLARIDDGLPPRAPLTLGVKKGNASRRLEELGLFEYLDGPDGMGRQRTWRRLTPKGWMVARILIAEGPRPEWLRALDQGSPGGPAEPGA